MPQRVEQLRQTYPNAQVEVWAFDEHRLGLKPIIRKTWSKRGQRPIATVHHRYQWLYLYAFVCPHTGLSHWFTPAKTIDCEIDLRPGGLFRTVMCSPEGQEFPNVGCYLEVIPNEKLVWTNALQPGYRPIIQSSEKNSGDFPFTAMIFS